MDSAKNIVHQSSSYGVSTTSSGRIFSKKRELEEASLEVKDQVYLSSPHEEQSGEAPSMEEQFKVFMQQMQREMQGANQLKGYAGLPKEEKTRYRDNLINLDKSARLFVKEEGTGQLRRCSAAEIKNIMDHNARVSNPADEKEALLITTLGQEKISSFQSHYSSTDIDGFFAPDVQKKSSGSSMGKRVIANYGTSKLKFWDDLDFVDMDGKGIPGTPELPPSGSSVTISRDWESKWNKESHVQDGFIWRDYYDDASGGHESSSYHPTN